MNNKFLVICVMLCIDFGSFKNEKLHIQIIALVCKCSEQADVDGNGTLDYGEFVAVSIHLKKMGNDDDHLQKAFLYFDQNRSGYIEIEELRESLADDLGSDQEEVINAIIGDVDTDKVRSTTPFNQTCTHANKILIIPLLTFIFSSSAGWTHKL